MPSFMIPKMWELQRRGFMKRREFLGTILAVPLCYSSQDSATAARISSDKGNFEAAVAATSLGPAITRELARGK
jgi:hypothetical protein